MFNLTKAYDFSIQNPTSQLAFGFNKLSYADFANFYDSFGDFSFSFNENQLKDIYGHQVTVNDLTTIFFYLNNYFYN